VIDNILKISKKMERPLSYDKISTEVKHSLYVEKARPGQISYFLWVFHRKSWKNPQNQELNCQAHHQEISANRHFFWIKKDEGRFAEGGTSSEHEKWWIKPAQQRTIDEWEHANSFEQKWRQQLNFRMEPTVWMVLPLKLLP